MSRRDRTPLLLFAACVVVGVLAALGTFNAMQNFPWIFALVCLALGSLSLWRDRARGAVLSRMVLLVAGASIAVGGWVYQGQVIQRRLATLQQETLASLGGKPAPPLAGLEPLATDRSALDAAASFAARATIISFWATWCSPCWVELVELDALYREHRERGLTVLALTRYSDPDSEETRAQERAGALAFLQRRGHTFPAAITANAEIYRAYQVRSIPSTALVDGRGRLVGYAVGLDGARVLMSQAEAMVTAATERMP